MLYSVLMNSSIRTSLKILLTFPELQNREQPQCLHFDGGGEYINSTFQKFLKSLCSKSVLVYSYTSENYENAESITCTFVGMMGAMLKPNCILKSL